MQKDLDAYLKTYNNERAHQGRDMKVRTPCNPFVGGIKKPNDKSDLKKAAQPSARPGRLCQVNTLSVHYSNNGPEKPYQCR